MGTMAIGAPRAARRIDSSSDCHAAGQLTSGAWLIPAREKRRSVADVEICYPRAAVPVPDHSMGDAGTVGPLGSLALSQVRPLSSSLALRAIRWHEGLERLGVVLPFAL